MDEFDRQAEALLRSSRRRESVLTLAVGIGAVVAGGSLLVAIGRALGWL